MRLSVEPFSALPLARDLDDLMSRESVLLLPDQPARGRPPYYDGPDCAWVMHLRDAVLYPPGSIPVPAAQGTAMPRPFHHAPAGRLLLAGPDRITCEAFMRPAHVPAGLCAVDAATWEADLPEPADTVEGPMLFADMLSGHFGHVILESTARLWINAVPELAPLTALPGIGFSHQGLRSLPADPTNIRWPGFVKDILRAAGMPAARLRVAARPLRVRSLIVPRRLSPFARGWGMGPAFGALMAMAGQRLAAGAAAGPAAAPRLYLSRSRLPAAARGLQDGQETEVEALFAARGFAVVHPQELPLSDQAALLRQATHVAGLQGSQLHLTAFAPDRRLSLLRIVPKFLRKNADGVHLAASGGKSDDFVVSELVPPGLVGNGHSYRLSPGELQALPARIDRWLQG